MSRRAVELILYHRYGCHLCEEMLERLRELETDWGFELLVKDVDVDPELVRRFTEKVPVLEGAGDEICRYMLDEEALEAYLQPPRMAEPRRSGSG